jgi:hypothetical protein
VQLRPHPGGAGGEGRALFVAICGDHVHREPEGAFELGRIPRFQQPFGEFATDGQNDAAVDGPFGTRVVQQGAHTGRIDQLLETRERLRRLFVHRKPDTLTVRPD